MGKKKSMNIPMSIKLVKSMLTSIYRDADRRMYICETLKGTPLLLPCSLSSKELFDKIWEVNRAEGTGIKTPKSVQRAPKQLGFAFEGTQSNPV